MTEEIRFVYFGARYLDPRTSRWISADPALDKYVPEYPGDEGAEEHNGNLPGMGGVFNPINFAVYHYAGNNPIKYEDPSGGYFIPPKEKSNMMDDKRWGNSNHLDGGTFKLTGCTMTASSNSISSLTNKDVIPPDLNKNINFTTSNEFSPQLTAKNYGLNYSQTTDNVGAKLKELGDSKQGYATIVDVYYDPKTKTYSNGAPKTHSLNVLGIETDEKGNVFVSVKPVSGQDTIPIDRRSDWIIQGSKILIPLADVVKVREYDNNK